MHWTKKLTLLKRNRRWTFWRNFSKFFEICNEYMELQKNFISVLVVKSFLFGNVYLQQNDYLLCNGRSLIRKCLFTTKWLPTFQWNIYECFEKISLKFAVFRTSNCVFMIFSCKEKDAFKVIYIIPSIINLGKCLEDIFGGAELSASCLYKWGSFPMKNSGLCCTITSFLVSEDILVSIH